MSTVAVFSENVTREKVTFSYSYVGKKKKCNLLSFHLFRNHSEASSGTVEAKSTSEDILTTFNLHLTIHDLV